MSRWDHWLWTTTNMQTWLCTCDCGGYGWTSMAEAMSKCKICTFYQWFVIEHVVLSDRPCLYSVAGISARKSFGTWRSSLPVSHCWLFPCFSLHIVEVSFIHTLMLLILLLKKVETSKDMRVINCIVTVQNPQICDSFLFICRGSSGLKYPLYQYFESPFLSQRNYKGCPGISQIVYKCPRDYRTIGNGQGSFTNVLHFVHLTHYFKITTISYSKRSQ